MWMCINAMIAISRTYYFIIVGGGKDNALMGRKLNVFYRIHNYIYIFIHYIHIYLYILNRIRGGGFISVHICSISMNGEGIGNPGKYIQMHFFLRGEYKACFHSGSKRYALCIIFLCTFYIVKQKSTK